jgi:predicted MFS family arabinose efflux permease
LLAAALSMQAPPRHADHGTAAHGVTYAEARRTRTFWTLCAMQFLFFPTLMTVPLHMAPHGRDLGLTETTAALLLTVMGLSSAAGRLAVGFLADRIGGKNAYTAALAVLVASLLGLSFVSAPAALFAVVAVYGAAHGAHFVVVSPTVASYFGMRAHGAIFGTVLVLRHHRRRHRPDPRRPRLRPVGQLPAGLPDADRRRRRWRWCCR